MKINPVMHDRTTHVEMDYHFVREKVFRGQLFTQFVKYTDRLADFHTKALTKQVFSGFWNSWFLGLNKNHSLPFSQIPNMIG